MRIKHLWTRKLGRKKQTETLNSILPWKTWRFVNFDDVFLAWGTSRLSYFLFLWYISQLGWEERIEIRIIRIGLFGCRCFRYTDRCRETANVNEFIQITSSFKILFNFNPFTVSDTYMGKIKSCYLLTWFFLIVLEYVKGFGVTEFKSEVGFSKFTITDPIWRNWNIENVRTFIKLVILRFFGSLHPILMFDFQNSKWRIQYGGPKLSKMFGYWQSWWYLSFWGRWIQIRCWIFKIQNGDSNMTDMNY